MIVQGNSLFLIECLEKICISSSDIWAETVQKHIVCILSALGVIWELMASLFAFVISYHSFTHISLFLNFSMVYLLENRLHAEQQGIIDFE